MVAKEGALVLSSGHLAPPVIKELAIISRHGFIFKTVFHSFEVKQKIDVWMF